MGQLLLTCKMCGTEFEYVKKSATGMIPKYCSDECRAKAQKEARRKYIENCKDKKAAKSKLKKMIEEQSIIPLPNTTSGFISVVPANQESSVTVSDMPEPKISRNIDDMVAYERNVMPEADSMTMKVLDFAMRLGQLKFEGHEILTELSKEMSEHDKQDEKFIHLVEAMNTVSYGQMKTIWEEEANSRANRRDTKTLYRIVNTMIYNIPQNPHQYAVKEIKNKEKTNANYAEKYSATKDEVIENDN